MDHHARLIFSKFQVFFEALRKDALGILDPDSPQKSWFESVCQNDLESFNRFLEKIRSNQRSCQTWTRRLDEGYESYRERIDSKAEQVLTRRRDEFQQVGVAERDQAA